MGGQIIVIDAEPTRHTRLCDMLGVRGVQNDRLCVLDIDNKYYTAEVQMENRDCASMSPPAFKDIQGVLLVAEYGVGSPGQVLQRLNDYDLSSDHIIMLLADCATPWKPDGSWESDARAACAAQGVEFCNVCLADSNEDNRLANTEDGGGIARVRAALDSQLWPVMEHKGISAKHRSHIPDNYDDSNSLHADQMAALMAQHEKAFEMVARALLMIAFPTSWDVQLSREFTTSLS
jgi:hypothetical protein